jgi:protein AATF/BFR2
MRPAKKARSEQLLEQLDPYQEAPDVLDDVDGDGGAVVEDLLEDFSGAVGAPQARKKALRRRAPLDSILQQGVYAAVPRHQVVDSIGGTEERPKKRPKKRALEADDGGYDAANVDLAMDDIFGLLDGGEEDDLMDDEDAAVLKNEEAYTAYLEKKQEKAGKARKAAAAVNGRDEGGILEQLKSLRSRQMNVVATDDDRQGKHSSGTADQDPDSLAASSRDFVRHPILLFNAVLRSRVALQSVLARALQLPQYYAMPSFRKYSAANASHADQCSRLCRDTLDLIVELANAYSSPAGAAGKTTAAGVAFPSGQPLEKVFAGLTSLHAKLMTQVNSTVEYWGSKVANPNSAKLQAVNLPLLDQIRAACAAKTARMEQTAQKNRSHVRIFGHPAHFTDAAMTERRALDIANGDVDTEIFDDGDFLRELVHKTGSSALGGEILAAGLAHGAEGTEASSGPSGSSKVRFHRLTKGKSVSYDPRPKLVGFMARVPYGMDEEQHSTLVRSLFQ